jgi:hypothetical protein
MTKAGTEIGVASTKAFTTQLTVLLMLVAAKEQRVMLIGETFRQLFDALILRQHLLDTVRQRPPGVDDQSRYRNRRGIDQSLYHSADRAVDAGGETGASQAIGY